MYKNLVVLGTNVSNERSEEISVESDPDMPVARAVRISMSLPLIFSPAYKYKIVFEDGTYVEVQHGKDIFVDGGLQLNNPISVFDKHAALAGRQAKSQPFFSEDFQQNEGKLDTLHISVLPWLSFTSFNHAVHLPNESGIPKLVFGQYDKSSGEMPLSIEVHHALMDGLHLAKFVRLLQSYFDQPELHFKNAL